MEKKRFGVFDYLSKSDIRCDVDQLDRVFPVSFQSDGRPLTGASLSLIALKPAVTVQRRRRAAGRRRGRGLVRLSADGQLLA